MAAANGISKVLVANDGILCTPVSVGQCVSRTMQRRKTKEFQSCSVQALIVQVSNQHMIIVIT